MLGLKSIAGGPIMGGGRLIPIIVNVIIKAGSWIRYRILT